DFHVKRFNWLALRVAAPFWQMGRHLLEMRYLWYRAHGVSAERLNELVPDFRPTPLSQALGRAVEHQIHPDKAVA
ncbi:MAG: epimerase, partial [Pseudomonadota bacterium]